MQAPGLNTPDETVQQLGIAEGQKPICRGLGGEAVRNVNGSALSRKMASFKKLQVLEFSDSLYRGLKELINSLIDSETACIL